MISDSALSNDFKLKMPINFDGKSGDFGACVAHMTSKGKSPESARSICGSIQSRQEKETKFCAFAKLQLKETKEDFHVSGFVATSHPDRAETEEFDGDIIPKSTLQKIVTDINNKYKPQAGAVSERHDHIKSDDIDLPVAGVLAPGTVATLQELNDGEWGVHVDTILSKTNPRYEEVKTNIEQGVYPGFSIEYANTEFVPTEKEGKKYRLLTNLDTEGFGYAHIRKIANPHAEYTDFGFKEIGKVMDMEIELKALHDVQSDIKKKKKKKVNKMEEKKEEAQKIVDEMKGKERTEVEAKLTEAEVPEAIIKELLPVGVEDPEPTEPTPPTEPSNKEHKVNEEDFALLTKFKEQKEKEAKVKEITGSNEFKEALKANQEAQIKEKSPLFNLEEKEGKPEFKEFDAYSTSLAKTKEIDKLTTSNRARFDNYKEIRETHDMTITEQYKEAGALAESFIEKGINVYGNWLNMRASWKEDIPDLVAWPRRNLGKHSALKEVNGRLEAKEFHRLTDVEIKANGGLGVTNATNANLNLADSSWTYGSYFLAPVELNDIFSPVLINQLNDQTTTYGRLTKEDWSGRSQIQFRARTGRNSTVGGYAEGVNLTYGTDFSGNVGRDKFQQPFAYYRVLVAVTGQAQRLGMAPGGIGDVWADEIKWSGNDLLANTGGLNLAVIGTGDGTSESTSLGFEGLILGTTGTLYGKALSSNATLRSHLENMTSASVTLKQLRKMIRFVSIGDGTGSSQIHSNSRLGDLVFFANHLQIDFVKGLIQDMQRLVPTSARVGFEGQVEFDGVPFVADRQINTDDIFLINVANTKLGVNLPPTLEPLPVTADAQAAHIKTYWNLYSDAPGNNYFARVFATS